MAPLTRKENAVGVFGPPNVARLDAMGKIDGLVKAAQYKKDPAVQAAAREALIGYLDQIIKRLQTKNLVQLRTAREALVTIGEPARDKLLFILREGHLHRRQDVAFVLGQMRDPAAVGPLGVALHNPDGLLRLIIVQALAKIGGPEAVEILRKALGDPEPKVAAEASKALRKLGATSS